MPSVEPQQRSTGGAEQDARQGGEMLAAFASVGAERFDLTYTDVAGVKVAFRSNRPFDSLQLALPDLLRRSAGRQHNVIVRPRSTAAALIQLDDLGQDAAEQLRPVSSGVPPVLKT